MNIESGAEFSIDRKYRYVLYRHWDRKRPNCSFIGLNPSTADENINDPTVTRCINYARLWGFGGMYMLNLFSFKATDPSIMRLEKEPVGKLNNFYIEGIVLLCTKIICCWGNGGVFKDRAREVVRLIGNSNDLYCLGVTKIIEPKHPLYLRGNIKPKIYSYKG